MFSLKSADFSPFKHIVLRKAWSQAFQSTKGLNWFFLIFKYHIQSNTYTVWQVLILFWKPRGRKIYFEIGKLLKILLEISNISLKACAINNYETN